MPSPFSCLHFVYKTRWKTPFRCIYVYLFCWLIISGKIDMSKDLCIFPYMSIDACFIDVYDVVV